MLITRSDYERIYRVINSLILNENANPAVACIFFSAYGSYILERHFSITASPRAGLAAYHLGDANVILFGEESKGHFTGDADGFHCWVEADGWAIDFMAPAFSKLDRSGLIIPSKIPAATGSNVRVDWGPPIRRRLLF